MPADNNHQPDPRDQPEPLPASPTLSIDWALYLGFLEDSDASEADKRALIECLWSIMVSFVDLGFRLSPLQEICGEPLALPLAKAEDVLDWDDASPRRTFAGAADAPPAPGRQA